MYKFLQFPYFFRYDFIIYIDISISQIQIQKLMTSQSTSYIEYVIRTYNIFVLILYSKLVKNLAWLTIFNTI